MRMRLFASRNLREMARDPLTLFFGIAFPLLLLILLSAIQANIPVSVFDINSLAPGIAVFGHSFLALFAGLLISKDRSTSFTHRLFASPMRESDFILGYALPMLPMALCQSAICLLAGCVLGMDIRNVPLTLVVLLPSAMVFIALGLLAGTSLNDKQVGGVCGALLTNLCAWLSGAWFDVTLVGGVFECIAKVLPFMHAVNAARAAVVGDFTATVKPLAIVAAYAIVLLALAIFLFRRKMLDSKR